MHVTYSYYTGTYGGAVIPSKGDFSRAAREAESYIRYLTYLNGDIFADKAQEGVIKSAVCAVADAYYEADREAAEGHIKSESKDGLSVSFVVARKDGETAGDYVKRCMYQAARTRLLPTGWLRRKVGEKYGSECRGFDGL